MACNQSLCSNVNTINKTIHLNLYVHQKIYNKISGPVHLCRYAEYFYNINTTNAVFRMASLLPQPRYSRLH